MVCNNLLNLACCLMLNELRHRGKLRCFLLIPFALLVESGDSGVSFADVSSESIGTKGVQVMLA